VRRGASQALQTICVTTEISENRLYSMVEWKDAGAAVHFAENSMNCDQEWVVGEVKAWLEQVGLLVSRPADERDSFLSHREFLCPGCYTAFSISGFPVPLTIFWRDTTARYNALTLSALLLISPSSGLAVLQLFLGPALPAGFCVSVPPIPQQLE
jgi:hypothetical protein